jgi:DNA polymerase III delta prime subunit
VKLELKGIRNKLDELEKRLKDQSKEMENGQRDSIYEEIDQLKEQEQEQETRLKQKPDPDSITVKTFITLKTLLTRSSEFFPNNDLFDKNLVYFPPHERHAMSRMQETLTKDNNDRMFLLYGNPASGKTVMGLAVAKELEKKYHVTLYHKITDDSNLEDLWLDMTRYGDQDILFILDDCHLKIEAVAEIYMRFEKISRASCLLISRKLPKNLRLIDEYLPDIFVKLEEQSYEMEVDRQEQVAEKMSGIIQRRKAYYEGKERREFFVGDEQKVIKNVRRNYLTLYFYLFFWPQVDILDQLDETGVLEKVHSRYLEIKENKPFKDVFLKYAALYRYEIQFRPVPGDTDAVEALTGRGLLEHSSGTNYYRFYHSDFAKLLLKSYASRPNFKEEYRNLETFSIQQIEAYFSGSDPYPPNIQELLNNLVVNKGIPIFRALLQKIEIREQIFSFYKSRASAYDLSRLLGFVMSIAPEHLESFIEALIVNNSSLKDLFLGVEQTAISFSNILRILKSRKPDYYKTFLELFNEEDKKQILLSSSLNAIGQFLATLVKYDSNTAKSFLDTLTTTELLEKTLYVEFHILGKALNELKNIDPEKSKDIFAAIEITHLVEKAKEVSFTNLGNALNQLKNVDTEKSKDILSAIEITHLVEKTKEVSFTNLGNALNQLKNIDPGKSKDILSAIEITHLVEIAKEVSFGRLGKALNELKNIDTGKSKEILSAIEITHLVEKTKEVSFERLGNALNQLKNVDTEKSKDILSAIEITHLVEKAKEVSFGRLGLALNELKNVDTGKSKDILSAIEIMHLVGKAKEVSFRQLGNALNELKNIDALKSKDILSAIEITHLVEKAKEVSLIDLGNALNTLKNVDPGKSKDTLSAIEITHLVNKTKEVSFGRLGLALNELKNVDTGKPKDILSAIEIMHLVGKAKEVSFRQLGNAICELEKVDEEKTHDILTQIGIQLVVSKIQEEKYTVFLQYTHAFARIHEVFTHQLFSELSREFLLQFNHLRILSNFNRLFAAFHLTGETEYIEELIEFTEQKMDTFMMNPLKDVATLLSQLSDYIDVKPLIRKYYNKFPGKIKYEKDASHTSYFIQVIHRLDIHTALKLLNYLEKQGERETLGSCYYRIGKHLHENESYRESSDYLKKARPIFEVFENNEGLAYTYFRMAKNEYFLTNNLERAVRIAKISFMYISELPELEKEIKAFNSNLSHE